MLNFAGVTLRRGPRKLLDDLSFTIYPGWRVGVVGRNGTGKSTLFAALLGELQPDAGAVSLPKGLTIATVAQETPALPDLAIEYTLDGDVELRQLEERLVKAEERHDLHAISDIHERLNTIGGYAARSRAARLLHGLGFPSQAQLQPVASFSGGWRMRLNLARTLMRRSDLMLLDEPTNHLDLDAVLWLQGWLVEYPGTLLVVSHDREFLDAVTTHTLHLHGGTAVLYTGNYSQFERQRAEKLTLQASAHAKQQRQIAHLQGFINRFKAQATKATQAQSRIKQLERMTLVEAVHADSEFDFEFPPPQRLPAPLVRFDEASVGYVERPGGAVGAAVGAASAATVESLAARAPPAGASRVILSHLKLLISPGERIGLLGPNGAGKSTLVRTLAGELPPLAGTATFSPHLKVGYFAQHQLEQLDPKASPILHFKRLDPRATEQELRTFLGGFNFRGDRVFEAVEPFSGGEKARLALALVAYQRPNLLLLDEPTNHLDLDMRHALEVALNGYAGAAVLVTHDRHLVSATCDSLLLVANGRCEPFEGDLDDYAQWLNDRDKAPQDGGARRDDAKAASAKDRRKAAADERALRGKVEKLDAQLNKLHVQLTTLDTRLADPALYASGRTEEAARLEREQRELRKQVAQIEEQWLAAADELEARGDGAAA